jgi:hypothetical protein
MNTDLSLAPNNNLIFQINPNVKPKLTGSGVTVASHYNDPLTESQQLALSANGNNVNVTGFNQAQYVKNGYVGGLSALNVQPTAVVATATPCNPEDIGSKALQMPKGGLERLAYSQMVCQKNPLCATTSPTETCYMPINTYSIEAHPNKFTFDAPDGFYIRYVHYKDQYADTRYFSDGQATSFRDPWGIMRCGSSECLKATSGQYNCHDSAGGWGMGEAWGTWQPRGSPLSAAQTFTISTDPSPFYTGLAVDEFLSNGTTMNNSTNGIGVINVDGLLVPKRAYGQYRYWWRQHDGDGGKCTYWWGGGFSRQDLVIDDVIYTNDVSQLQAIVN